MQEPNDETVLATIKKQFKKYLSNPENIESSANSLVDDLIDDAIMSIVFEVDIKRKFKINEIVKGDNDSASFTFKDSPGLDIFGHSINDKFGDCVCPCCNRSIAAARFAPHLAKCMGMGRNSSRIARSRIASNANKESGGTSVGTVSDDEDDADWTVMTEKKGKRKKEKLASKKLKTSKQVKNGSQAESGGSSSYQNISYESMTERDRRALLSQICGVISESTKKVCTKSTKCPLHSEEQKKAVRDIYLSENMDPFCIENLQIDVDTCEDEEELAKEGLIRSWEAEHSNTSSPADSASTSSSSSKKRDKNSFKKKE